MTELYTAMKMRQTSQRTGLTSTQTDTEEHRPYESTYTKITKIQNKILMLLEKKKKKKEGNQRNKY